MLGLPEGVKGLLGGGRQEGKIVKTVIAYSITIIKNKCKKYIEVI